jgi:hypothetical protein
MTFPKPTKFRSLNPRLWTYLRWLRKDSPGQALYFGGPGGGTRAKARAPCANQCPAFFSAIQVMWCLKGGPDVPSGAFTPRRALSEPVIDISSVLLP